MAAQDHGGGPAAAALDFVTHREFLPRSPYIRPTERRSRGFPEGTEWRRRIGGAWKDKDVHSYRGLATTMLKGRVSDSLRCDIFGHEGETETASTYDDEADLDLKLGALMLLTPLTAHIQPHLPIKIRPLDRLRHGASWRRPRLKTSKSGSLNGATPIGKP